jgi:hypothetical protein
MGFPDKIREEALVRSGRHCCLCHKFCGTKIEAHHIKLVADGEKGSSMKRKRKDPDMLEEYDFSKGIRGKYAKRYAEGANVVVIEPDVAKYFPDHDSVNQALRSLSEIIKKEKRSHNNGDRADRSPLRCSGPAFHQP